jgi:hypothetical protein
MLTHSVYFWLRDDLTPDQLQAFRAGLETLRGIPTVHALYVGVPAPTAKRAVIEDTYTFGLVVVFPDMAGHDAYQVHSLHKAFLERFLPYWTRVAIYDFE